jgi:hypothetical protein
MKKLSISPDLEEKIHDLKIDDSEGFSKIITYFPLNPNEKQEILKALEKPTIASIDFKSIFSDEISQLEWSKSKEQIKKKFQDELIGIN